MMANVPPVPATPPESGREVAGWGRHATNLELFLDLVFVFAVTQLATLIAQDPTAGGVLKALLMAFLVWWLWSQFTWAGAAVDLQSRAASRFLVLGTIPVTLLMTVSLPDAFTDTGRTFAWSYFGVQTLVVAMQGAFTLHQRELREAFVRYSSLAFVSPLVVVVGAYLDGDARVIAWTVAAAISVAAALRGGGEWAIDPTHFSERHALFVIIALGEVVVAAGVTAYSLSQETGLGAGLVAAVLVAAGAAGVLWWAYFAYVPTIGERHLAAATGPARGRLARDFYTFGHFPLIVGIILFSVVVDHMLEHPGDPLEVSDRWLLAISVVAFAGALTLLRLRVARKLSPERLLTIAAAAAVCAFVGRLSAIAMVVIVAALYGVTHTIRYALFKREEATAQSGG